MSDRDAFQRSLDEYRFEEARSRVEAAPPDQRPELAEAVESSMRAAARRASELKERIIALGEKEHYRELMAIESDPATARLLDLLAAPARQRTEIYLREAAHWAEKQVEINARRLVDAREAINALDAKLGKAILHRVDDGFLSASGVEERDLLLIDLEALTMDLEEITATADDVLSSERPNRPWWKRS